MNITTQAKGAFGSPRDAYNDGKRSVLEEGAFLGLPEDTQLFLRIDAFCNEERVTLPGVTYEDHYQRGRIIQAERLNDFLNNENLHGLGSFEATTPEMRAALQSMVDAILARPGKGQPVPTPVRNK